MTTDPLSSAGSVTLCATYRRLEKLATLLGRLAARGTDEARQEHWESVMDTHRARFDWACERAGIDTALLNADADLRAVRRRAYLGYEQWLADLHERRHGVRSRP